MNNYGPNKNYGSVHLELPDTMTVEEVDVLTRRVQSLVYKETGVILTGVGVYSFNTKNEEAVKIRNTVQEVVLSNQWALQLHGFYVDIKNKDIRFDVVLSFDIEQKEALETLYRQMKAIYPDYFTVITIDVDAAD